MLLKLACLLVARGGAAVSNVAAAIVNALLYGMGASGMKSCWRHEQRLRQDDGEPFADRRHLRERGLDVAPCKVGPDYIDTGFHELVCGRPSHNLDSFWIEPRDLPTLLTPPADITVIGGRDGLCTRHGCDGAAANSTWEMARRRDARAAGGGRFRFRAATSGRRRSRAL